jgi:hypothetical protein
VTLTVISSIPIPKDKRRRVFFVKCPCCGFRDRVSCRGAVDLIERLTFRGWHFETNTEFLAVYACWGCKFADKFLRAQAEGRFKK